jgi:lactoylglutathione lyase
MYKIVKIAIMVKKIEKSIDFYVNKIGMKMLERFPQPDGSECVFIDAGSVILELMPQNVGGEHLHHIALGVEDINSEIDHFMERSVPITMEHVVVEDNIHLADLKDPDGVRIRLFHRDVRGSV